MFRVLHKYLFAELLVPFLLGLGVFTAVVLVARIVKLVEMVVNRGVPFLEVFKIFSLIMPQFLEVTVPMALLLAILLAFGRLSSDSEIVAMKTSGVSLYQMMWPVGTFTLLTVICTFVLASWVRPWANRQLETQLLGVAQSRAAAGFKEQVFIDDFPGLVIYVEEIEDGGNTLKGVLIADQRSPRENNTVIAKLGLLLPGSGKRAVTLRLVDGSIYSTSEKAGSFQKTDFNGYDVSLSLENLIDSADTSRDAKELTLNELSARIDQKRSAGRSSTEDELEFHRKFSIPFACLVFTLVGVPLGIQPTRAVRSRGFAVSLGVIFLYYVLLTVGETLGKRETVAPALALWVPNLAFLGIGLMLFQRAASESPLPGAEYVSALRARIVERFRQHD